MIHFVIRATALLALFALAACNSAPVASSEGRFALVSNAQDSTLSVIDLSRMKVSGDGAGSARAGGPCGKRPCLDRLQSGGLGASARSRVDENHWRDPNRA